LMAASDCLTNVSQANPSAAIPSAEALRRLGQLRAHLEYSDMAQLMEQLDKEMVQVQDVAAAVTATVSTSFFAAADPTAWITEGTR
jgi:A predicted alpha-helical domain with a conserved ER motif.